MSALDDGASGPEAQRAPRCAQASEESFELRRKRAARSRHHLHGSSSFGFSFPALGRSESRRSGAAHLTSLARSAPGARLVNSSPGLGSSTLLRGTKPDARPVHGDDGG